MKQETGEMALPLLVRLCREPTTERRLEQVVYDSQTETATLESGHEEIVATQSLLTNAQVDPTNDEPTDR
jgi:hypothetical protein